MTDAVLPVFAADEDILEQARSYREGREWLEAELREHAERGLEAPMDTASATPISDRAFDMIVFFEVTSKEVYIRKFQSPIWPKGSSGVTIGIGYDVGFASKQQLHDDWSGVLPRAMVTRLERALGVKGMAAKPLAAELAAEVTVPWDAALAIHRTRVLPRWVAIAERNLPNCSHLTADCLGALTSLTYNRGASFSKAGERFLEMRAIKQQMQDRQFSRVPAQFRAMKRLWPDLLGLQTRRDREATLFEEGLRSPQA